MAQTIVAQRGSTTVTTNGQTSVTLFTQSSGIATRVILNSVSWGAANGGMNPRMSLMININGTGNETCVAILGGTNASGGNGQTMFPNCSPFPMNNTTAVANAYIDRWIVASLGGSSTMIGKNLTNGYWLFYGPNGSDQSSQFANIEFVPSQFWMNSGDSLVFRCYKSGSAETANVYYSFTTITES